MQQQYLDLLVHHADTSQGNPGHFGTHIGKQERYLTSTDLEWCPRQAAQAGRQAGSQAVSQAVSVDEAISADLLLLLAPHTLVHEARQTATIAQLNGAATLTSCTIHCWPKMPVCHSCCKCLQ